MFSLFFIYMYIYLINCHAKKHNFIPLFSIFYIIVCNINYFTSCKYALLYVFEFNQRKCLVIKVPLINSIHFSIFERTFIFWIYSRCENKEKFIILKRFVFITTCTKYLMFSICTWIQTMYRCFNRNCSGYSK